MFNQKEIKALFDIFKSGSIENVELAIQLAQNSDIDLCFPHFEELFDYLVKIEAFYHQGNLSLSEKIHHILTTESLKLEIKETAFSIIPASIYLLKSLKQLTIAAFVETHVPYTISYFEALEELEIYLLDQEKLPMAIFDIHSLVKLDLSLNLFDELPREIWQLRNLKELNLLNCVNLYKLPNELFGLPQLETVILLNTSINEISPSIAYSNIQQYILEFNAEGKKFMADPIIGKKMLKLMNNEQKATKAFQERIGTKKFFKNEASNVPNHIKDKGLDAIKEYFKGKP